MGNIQTNTNEFDSFRITPTVNGYIGTGKESDSRGTQEAKVGTSLHFDSRLEKKLQKLKMGANMRDESKWPKCIVWFPNRARFCSGERVPGSKYCVNHIHLDGEVGEHKRRRVVCPIDPSHTVYEDKLEKHIKICNKSKQNEEVMNCPYFILNCNQGDAIIHEVVSFASPTEVSAVKVFNCRKSSLSIIWSRKFVGCIL